MMGSAANRQSFRQSALNFINQYGFDGLDHFRGRDQRQFLKIGRIGHRHIFAGAVQDRCIEVIEGMGHDVGRQVVADGRDREALFDGDAAIGLADTLDNGRNVHWPQCA